jgi:UDP-glucose 4-epimerase
MKIVVTGALGHIGSYLIRELAQQFPGAEIVMIDNMLSQRFPSLFNLPMDASYNFIEADVTQVDLRPWLNGADVLIHLAAITDAAGSFANAEIVEMNNYNGTMRVVDACVDTQTRLIALSSTSVYGAQNKLVAEDCPTGELNPQSPYAVTKLKEELYVEQACKSRGLKAVICRFGTIFGGSIGMRFHTAVNKFCWQAVMGVPMTVWSTAFDQKRPYLDLLDGVRAICFMIRKDLFAGQIYNVLTYNQSVREVVDVIKEYVPHAQVTFVDNPIMNQLSYEVSCSRLLAQGFNFAGDIHRGISETIKLLKNAGGKKG